MLTTRNWSSLICLHSSLSFLSDVGQEEDESPKEEQTGEEGEEEEEAENNETVNNETATSEIAEEKLEEEAKEEPVAKMETELDEAAQKEVEMEKEDEDDKMINEDQVESESDDGKKVLDESKSEKSENGQVSLEEKTAEAEEKKLEVEMGNENIKQQDEMADMTTDTKEEDIKTDTEDTTEIAATTETAATADTTPTTENSDKTLKFPPLFSKPQEEIKHSPEVEDISDDEEVTPKIPSDERSPRHIPGMSLCLWMLFSPYSGIISLVRAAITFRAAM